MQPTRLIVSIIATLAMANVFAGHDDIKALPIETKFAQVAPAFREKGPFKRSAEQKRAVVLIPGLRLHPFSSRNVAKASWHRWQKPDSVLVKAAAKDADVFAFAYSQNEAVEKVSETAGLKDNIRLLKKMGYSEIVLIGHSGGGLVARHLVEDHPDIGVTRVIQICSPNAGTTWGKALFGVREAQEKFVLSLSKDKRREFLERRADKTIPAKVDFVCVVGQVKLPNAVTIPLDDDGQAKITLNLDKLRGDGLVSAASQWPADLQKQGIPAVQWHTTHFTVMDSKAQVERLAQLIPEECERWNAEKVAEARRRILGMEKE